MKENKLVTWEMFQKYHEQLMDYITSRDGLTVDGEDVKEYYEHLVSELPDHIDPLMPLEFEEDINDETTD